MGKTKDYLDYLNNEMGISPASSQEELDCAQSLANEFSSHGLNPQIQEFSAPALGLLPYGVAMVFLFVGIILAGIGGVVSFVGIVLVLIGVCVLAMRNAGKDVFAKFGPRSHSQNVVALRKADGDEKSRERPIVIIAHYDTQRNDLLSRPGLASIKRTLVRVSPYATIAVAVCTLAQLLVFLPAPLRRTLWVIGIVASLPMVLWGVSLIASKFMPYSNGAIDNKSSVAAMLGVLDYVTNGTEPLAHREEERRAREQEQMREDDVSPEPAPSVQVAAAAPVRESAVRPAEPRREPAVRREVEKVVGTRHGESVLRALGILPETCEITYIAPEVRVVPVVEPMEEPTPQVAQACQPQQGFVEAPAAQAAQSQQGHYADTSEGEASQPQQAYAEAGVAQAPQSQQVPAAPSQPAVTDVASQATSVASCADQTAVVPRAAETIQMPAAGVTTHIPASVPVPAEVPVPAVPQVAVPEPAAVSTPAAVPSVAPESVSTPTPRSQRVEHAAEPAFVPEPAPAAPNAASPSSPDAAESAAASTSNSVKAAPAESAATAARVVAPSAQPAVIEPGSTSSMPVARPASVVLREQEEAAAEPVATAANSELGEDVVTTVSGEQIDYSNNPYVERSGEEFDYKGGIENTEQGFEPSNGTAPMRPLGVADRIRAGVQPGAGEGKEAPSPKEVFAGIVSVVKAFGKSIAADKVSLMDASFEELPDDAPVESEPVGDVPAPDGAWDEPEPSSVAAPEAEGWAEEQPAEFPGDEAPSDDEHADEDEAYPETSAHASATAESEAQMSAPEAQRQEPAAEPEDETSADADATVVMGAQSEDEGDATTSLPKSSVFDRFFSNSLDKLENGQRTDEGPTGETDQTGLNTMVEEDANSAAEADRPERTRPAAIDDPNWGKSTFTPTRPAQPTKPMQPAQPIGRRSALFDLPDPFAVADPLSSTASLSTGDSDATAPMKRRVPSIPAIADDEASADSTAPMASRLRVRVPAVDQPSEGASAPMAERLAEASRSVSVPNPVRIEGTEAQAPQTGRTPSRSAGNSLSSYVPARPEGQIKVLKSDAGQAGQDGGHKKHRLSGLFGHKREQQESMSEWLGVDEDFNAKTDGEHIGSWDNFDSDERDGRRWKGGAARSVELRGGANGRDDDVDVELRDAVLAMDDDVLRAHDIWFVATGASALDHAGIKEFVESHRRDLRGSFIVNLECVGAGSLTVLTREGLGVIRRADRRCSALLSAVANDLHIPLSKEDRAWADTEATPLMRKSLRAVTIMGIGEGDLPAFSRTDYDVPENVDEAQVEDVAALITEMIRRA